MATLEDNSLDQGHLRCVRGGFAITPSDTVNFTRATRRVYATGAGNIRCIMADNSGPFTFAMAAGQERELAVKRINATLTTATGLIGLY